MKQTVVVTAFILAPAQGPADPQTPAAIMARLSVPALPAGPCQHNHVDYFTTGGYTFGQNGVDDNIRDVFYCLDCGATVPAPSSIPVESCFDEITF